MAESVTSGGFADAIGFVASVGFTGSLVAGTVGWFFRRLDERLAIQREIDVAEWTLYGGLVGGWLAFLVVAVAAALG